MKRAPRDRAIHLLLGTDGSHSPARLCGARRPADRHKTRAMEAQRIPTIFGMRCRAQNKHRRAVSPSPIPTTRELASTQLPCSLRMLHLAWLLLYNCFAAGRPGRPMPIR